MCRIAGIISKALPSEHLEEKVKAMTFRMKHGGPDGEGIYVNKEHGIYLGHRRLALLDLSNAGRQPMAALDEHIWISYNGEVYNFGELRHQLESLGHHFISGTDTEVILKAYIEWGTEAFNRFNGMFAFCLVDLRIAQIYLVRDAAGIKPLYYRVSEKELLFASEVKALKKTGLCSKPNDDWKLLLLAFGHMPEPYTTLKEVFALPKGHYLSYNLSSGIHHLKSFGTFGFIKPSILSKNEAMLLIREKLQKAVNRQLIADAPIGLFLSGGIDSSLLTALAATTSRGQLQTLSVTFNEKTFSEKEYQQAVIDQVKCKHHFSNVGKGDFEKNLETIIAAYDQPSNDGINSWFISKCAKANGLTAVLSGLGSDEIFGGYPSFHRIDKLMKLKRLPTSFFKLAPRASSKLQRLEWLQVEGTKGSYLALRGFFSPTELPAITGLSRKEIVSKIGALQLQPQNSSVPVDEYACWLEFNHYMQNQLLRDSDYMSMQHGLELRVPFLDQEFLETVFNVHPSLLYKHNGIPKQLLIDSFEDILPEAVWNRKKMGFSFPFQNWLGEMTHVRDSLSTTRSSRKLLADFDKGQLHWSKLWTYFLSENFAD